MPARKGLVLLVLSLLLLAPVEAYKGSQLTRGPVDSFQLIDQNGDAYSFDFDSEGIIVASFIFTRCPDVCPVITQSLKSVEQELTERERQDVTFVSITVDPEYDTPERLAAYADLHGVDWPHLTGTVEELEPVWATFGLVVQTAVIEAHVMAYQPAESSVTIAGTDNADGQYMFTLNASTATQMLTEERNWTLNTSLTSFGTMLHGINGVDAPDDGAWYWELNIWNESGGEWMASEVGMDVVDVLQRPHFAWAASNANRSNLSAPDLENGISMSVVWPNGSVDAVSSETFTGYHLTEGALGEANINRTIESQSFGHYLSSLDDVPAPDDWSWWWNLFVWNRTTGEWATSEVGMDDLAEPEHIAWAPSTINASSLPSPVSGSADPSVCNGHGWHMGSGEGKHCMCDDGYAWGGDDRLSCVLEVNEEYTVGHSTIVYILNPAREPVVAWAGDDWHPEDMASDIQAVLEVEKLGGHEPEVTPGFGILGVFGASLVAFMVGSRTIMVNPNQAKGEKTEAHA